MENSVARHIDFCHSNTPDSHNNSELGLLEIMRF